MIDFRKVTLSNGLRVIAHQDLSTPMVTTNILYNVGARDESEEATGFAHLFEHLMFGGTVNVPQFDTPVMLAGGENNAFTNNDITNYFITIPSDNIDTALWLEADRMKGLDLSETGINIQKSVVTEEYRQRYLNQPYGDLYLLIRPLAYRVHPYRWAAIGKEISHIERADSRSIREFYSRHYSPGNAILAVAGNIDPEEVFEKAESRFGHIKPSLLHERNLPREPRQSERRQQTVYRNVPGQQLMMAFHMDGRASDQFYALDMLTDILAGCDSGRFPEILVRRKKLFTEADIFLSGEIDPGLVIFNGRLRDGVDIETAEYEVMRELNRVTSEPVSDSEIEKARNRYESLRLISYTSAANKAFNLAFHELLGDAEGLNREIERYMEVTPTKIIESSAPVFSSDNCSVLYYLPELK